jgi:hypothetical protein
MNYTRVAVAAFAGTIADFAYGFLVYGNLLTSSFLAQPNIYRPAEMQMAYMPVGAGGILLAMVAATLLFASGSRRGAVAGLRFGLLLAMFAIGAAALVNFSAINMTADHAVKMVAAALGEWLVVGAVIGAAYGQGPKV